MMTMKASGVSGVYDFMSILAILFLLKIFLKEAIKFSWLTLDI